MNFSGCSRFRIFQNRPWMFGYGNLVMTIELHLSPGKSTPLAHLVVNRMSVSPDVNLSTAVLPFDCSSLSFSCVIRLSSFRISFSVLVGRSLNAEMWMMVGCSAFAMHMSRILRYWFRVIVLFLKLLKAQFFSNPVRCLFMLPGFWVSASMILKSVNPNMSFRTCSECSVPDIITRTLFCSISSFSFCARLIDTIFAIVVSSEFENSDDWLGSFFILSIDM